MSIRDILRRLRFQPARERCFYEDYLRYNGILYVQDLGTGEVPLSAIVGTAVRCRTHERSPSPRQLRKQLRKSQQVPPAHLLQLEGKLYVADGQALIKAARALRLSTVPAHVLAYVQPMRGFQGLLQQERAAFERETGLSGVALSLPGRYPVLIQQIRAHQTYLENTRGHLFLFTEAAADWWQNLFQPVVEGLRQELVSEEGAALLEGDLYALLAEHVQREARRLAVPPSKIVLDLIEAHGLSWRDKLAAVVPPCLLGERCIRR